MDPELSTVDDGAEKTRLDTTDLTLRLNKVDKVVKNEVDMELM
jgi:hypothetical protein